MRSDKDLGHGSGCAPAQVGGNLGQHALVGNNVFRLTTAAGDAEDALPRLPHLYVRSYGGNLAGKLHAGDILRRIGRRRIVSLTLEQVGTIQPGRIHAHLNFMGRGLRSWNFPDIQHLRPAWFGNYDCLHGFASWLLAFGSSLFALSFYLLAPT